MMGLVALPVLAAMVYFAPSVLIGVAAWAMSHGVYFHQSNAYYY